eukprot:scaffold237939_cov20-Tisochrysis_lutea.AAC.1
MSLCAPSQARPHTLILLRSFHKIGTFILLSLNSALIPAPYPPWKLPLPNIPALKPGSKPAAKEILTGTTT